MPKWIHDRADHIQSKNPSMPRSESFAIATQQAHAVGKSPKGYGTSGGREKAHAKYPTPGDDSKTAASMLEEDRLSSAEFLLKMAEVSAGQWWEEVGGPHLAKGGDKKSFKKLMNEAGLSASHQRRFETAADRVFKQKEENTPRAGGQSGAAGHTTNEHGEQVPMRAPSMSPGKIQTGLYGAATLGGLGYLAAGEQTKNPDAAPQEWKGRLGSHLGATVPLAIAGNQIGLMGRNVATRIAMSKGRAAPGKWQHAPAIAGAIGAAGGALLAEGGHYLNKKYSPDRGEAAFDSKKDTQDLIESASRTGASHGRSQLLLQGGLSGLNLGLVHSRLRAGNPMGGEIFKQFIAPTLPGAAASLTLGSVGSGLSREYGDSLAMGSLRKMQDSPPELSREERRDRLTLHGSNASFLDDDQTKNLASAEKDWDAAHTPTRNGALTGLGLGAAMGAVLTARSRFPELAGTGGLAGAAGGALLGAQIGNRFGDEKARKSTTKREEGLHRQYSKVASDEKTAGWGKTLKKGLQTAGVLAGAGLVGAVAGPTMAYHFGPDWLKKPVRREVHDPRIYSNIRGKLTGESKEEIRAHHKHLKRGDHSVLEAMREGLFRPGEKTAKRYKLEGDALIECDENGKSLGKGPVNEDAKTAAGAPTRGGFMMASDVPPFKVPSLARPVEKRSDMLPDGITYGPGDFKPARLTKMGGFSSPVLMQAAHAKTVGLPKVSAPPGPSIAEIAKPKGPGMGAGIAGAFKNSIGGTGGVSTK